MLNGDGTVNGGAGLLTQTATDPREIQFANKADLVARSAPRCAFPRCDFKSIEISDPCDLQPLLSFCCNARYFFNSLPTSAHAIASEDSPLIADVADSLSSEARNVEF